MACDGDPVGTDFPNHWRAHARELYRRAGFGGTPEEIADAVTNGIDRTLDQLLTIEEPSSADVSLFG